MEKYFKIGEISRLYGIGVDSLRYYEELGIIKPGRSESGYRLYSINDIWRLNVIRDLRELGFGMESIREYLDCHSVEKTIELLEDEKNTIDRKLKKLKFLRANVEKRLSTVRMARTRPLYKIALEEYKPRKCFMLTEGYSDEHEMDILIKRLLNIDKKHFYVIGNNQIGTVISRDIAERTGELRYQSVFIIDDNGETSLQGGTYLTVSYKGSYSQSGEWVKKLFDYAAKNRLEPTGNILELLWIDIHTSSDENEHITELQVQVKK